MTVVYFAALRTETSIRLSWRMVLSWRQLAGAELKISSLAMHADLRPSTTFCPWKGRRSMLSWRPPRYRSFSASDEVNPSLPSTKPSITDPLPSGRATMLLTVELKTACFFVNLSAVTFQFYCVCFETSGF